MKYRLYNHNWPAYEPIFQQGPSWHSLKNHYCRFLLSKKSSIMPDKTQSQTKAIIHRSFLYFFLFYFFYCPFFDLKFFSKFFLYHKITECKVSKKMHVPIIKCEKVLNVKIVCWSCHKNIFSNFSFMFLIPNIFFQFKF